MIQGYDTRVQEKGVKIDLRGLYKGKRQTFVVEVESPQDKVKNVEDFAEKIKALEDFILILKEQDLLSI